MKIASIRKFLVNVILYSAIAISLYLLYSPFNNYTGEKTKSTVKFIYQQF